MTVHFIGAGPGAADLITVRGRDLIARCPVCLYAGSIVPPALLLPNDGDFSYCKIRLDPVSRNALASSLGRLSDPLSRAVAWNGVRDLVRDGDRHCVGPRSGRCHKLQEYCRGQWHSPPHRRGCQLLEHHGEHGSCRRRAEA